MFRFLLTLGWIKIIELGVMHARSAVFMECLTESLGLPPWHYKHLSSSDISALSFIFHGHAQIYKV